MSVDGGNEKSRSRSSSETGGEAHERTGICPQRRRWIKYAVGAALVFGICVLYGGMGLSHRSGFAPLPGAALARAAPPLDCSLEYSRLIFRIKCPLGDNMDDGVGHENVKVLPSRDELVKPGPAVK